MVVQCFEFWCHIFECVFLLLHKVVIKHKVLQYSVQIGLVDGFSIVYVALGQCLGQLRGWYFSGLNQVLKSLSVIFIKSLRKLIACDIIFIDKGISDWLCLLTIGLSEGVGSGCCFCVFGWNNFVIFLWFYNLTYSRQGLFLPVRLLFCCFRVWGIDSYKLWLWALNVYGWGRNVKVHVFTGNVL